MCDEAQKAALSELYNRLDRQELAAVEEIDRALAKMAAADYGRCEQCAKTIPLERLRMLPATRYCVKCSRERESAGHR